MNTVLVIGASRGIGLELVRQYREAGHRVIATVRDDAGRARVQALGAQALTVDVANPASVSGLAWQLDGEKISLALYVAGLWDANGARTPPNREQFDRVMHTNVLGAMQALPQVAPLLDDESGVFAFLSSQMSLISETDSDAWLYRVSKAALNMVVAAAQPAWPRATLVALDPGWTQTDMGGPGAQIDPETSITGFRKVIDGLATVDSGAFLDYQGNRLEW